MFGFRFLYLGCSISIAESVFVLKVFGLAVLQINGTFISQISSPFILQVDFLFFLVVCYMLILQCSSPFVCIICSICTAVISVSVIPGILIPVIIIDRIPFCLGTLVPFGKGPEPLHAPYLDCILHKIGIRIQNFKFSALQQKRIYKQILINTGRKYKFTEDGIIPVVHSYQCHF